MSQPVNMGSALDRLKESFLWAAARGGRVEEVASLLEMGADIEWQSQDGDNALLAAARNGHLDVCEFLLAHGADVGAASAQGASTALHYACRRGDEAMAAKLLDAGAAHDAADAVGRTPFDDAVAKGFGELTERLAAAGARGGRRSGGGGGGGGTAAQRRQRAAAAAQRRGGAENRPAADARQRPSSGGENRANRAPGPGPRHKPATGAAPGPRPVRLPQLDAAPAPAHARPLEARPRLALDDSDAYGSSFSEGSESSYGSESETDSEAAEGAAIVAAAAAAAAAADAAATAVAAASLAPSSARGAAQESIAHLVADLPLEEQVRVLRRAYESEAAEHRAAACKANAVREQSSKLWTELMAAQEAGKRLRDERDRAAAAHRRLGALDVDGMDLAALQALKAELRAAAARTDRAIAQRRAEAGVPDAFMCPITREVMADPVMSADGHTYEKAAIAEWLGAGRNLSPSTGLPLTSTALLPNHALRNAIQAWAEERARSRAEEDAGSPVGGGPRAAF